MKIQERPCQTGFPLEGLDATTQAALTAHQQAQQNRVLHREQRRAFQEERLRIAQHTANKLRQMAKDALGSGLFQGLFGLASAACSLSASLKQNPAGTSTKILEGVGRVAQATAAFDPCRIQQQTHAAQKQELDVDAERATYRMQEASDEESNAHRMEDSILTLLQKIEEKKSAVAQSAVERLI